MPLTSWNCCPGPKAVGPRQCALLGLGHTLAARLRAGGDDKQIGVHFVLRFRLVFDGRHSVHPIVARLRNAKVHRGSTPVIRPCDRAEPDGRAVCQAEFLSTLAWPLDARVKGEFDPNPARLAHDEMDLRPLARELRGEFHNNARPAGNAFIQGIQSRSIGDCEG